MLIDIIVQCCTIYFMNTPIYIDSSKFRNNFANVLNSVFEDRKTYIINKSGIPVAKIVSLEKDDVKNDDFMSLTGILSEKEGDKISKMIKKGRNDGSKLKSKLI